ncbi:MAG: cation diffusion facilitator family transporter [Bacteroidales bacterium]|nr:cation diffusion facilitator family transporter [Bacteroidales bacterium]MDD4217194.1 cation diffusion facilitator family transporter [Bacteroidales bacterium]MDY0140970.1 cation diffusion facilitator family transporter [Bacteroidales bacterium]
MHVTRNNRNKQNYLGGGISIVVNLLLFVLKYWAGIVSGSLSLMADAWHTLSDSLSSIIMIVGTKLSSKKPDKEHPFGHGRWENLAAIFIGILLAIVAYRFMHDSIIKLRDGGSAQFGTLAIIVTAISIVFKEALAQMSFYIARKTNNSAMKADGWHHRSDALSSVAIMIGIFLQPYFWWMDSLLGIIVSLILFYAVFGIIKEAINKILGEPINESVVESVRSIIIEKHNNDLGVHHFHCHDYGDHKEMTFHIKLHPDLSVDEAHKIANDIEKTIKSELNITSTVHVEPKT